MRKISLILLSFSLLGCALHLDQSHNIGTVFGNSQAHEQLINLPCFIDRGYNIFEGNPMTENFDPGFAYPIFSFTAIEGRKTSDEKFLIPDQVLSVKMQAWSKSNFTKTINGSLSYQKQLKKFAQFGVGGSDTIFAKGAFSLSSNFQAIEKKTLVHHQVITQSYQQRIAYRLNLIESRLKLTDGFRAAVKKALSNSRKWSSFIKHFGTHYVTEMDIGRKVVLQLQFSENSVKKLQKEGSSLEASAQGRFKFFLNLNYSNKSSVLNEFNLKNQKVSYKDFYFGCEPPQYGKIEDCLRQNLVAPMPIRYELQDISQLFKLMETEIDYQKAQTQFKTAVEKYCEEHQRCRKPKLDYKPPQPRFRSTNPVGGQGGNPFNYTVPHPEQDWIKLSKVVIRSGKFIDAIKFVFSGFQGNRPHYYQSKFYGGKDGQQNTWEIPKWQYISKINIWHSMYVNAIQFITNEGKKSPNCFGSRHGNKTQIDVGNGKLVGLRGFSGELLDKIAFQIFQMV